MSATASSHPSALGADAMTHNPGVGASHPGATAGSLSPSSVPQLGRAVSNGSLANLFRRHAEREEESQRNAEILRAKLAEGFSVRAAAAALGWSRAKAKEIASKFGLKADPATIKRAELQGARKAGAVIAERTRKPPKPPKEPRAKAAPKPKPEPVRLERNPFLSAAQQASVDRHKERCWASASNRRLAEMGPPTRDEADRLVAEFIARRGVTVCPPAAPVLEPINSGARWR